MAESVPRPSEPVPGIPTLDAALPPACLAAAELATDRFCDREPQLIERYGERGRAYTLHDFTYLFAWAMDAQALDAPAVFDRNVLWLADLLAARDFPMIWYVGSVRLAREVAVEQGLLTEDGAVRLLDPTIAALESRG